MNIFKRNTVISNIQQQIFLNIYLFLLKNSYKYLQKIGDISINVKFQVEIISDELLCDSRSSRHYHNQHLPQTVINSFQKYSHDIHSTESFIFILTAASSAARYLKLKGTSTCTMYSAESHTEQNQRLLLSSTTTESRET